MADTEKPQKTANERTADAAKAIHAAGMKALQGVANKHNIPEVDGRGQAETLGLYLVTDDKEQRKRIEQAIRADIKARITK